jgi:hypothetical protein
LALFTLVPPPRETNPRPHPTLCQWNDLSGPPDLLSAVFNPLGRYDEILTRVTGPIDGEYKNPGFGYDACFGLCSDKQLYLPKWLEGSWEVESTYMGKAFPRGEKYVYRSIREGSARSAKEKVGDVTSYKARYVAAEAGGSAFGVGRGEKKTIQDRAFNTAEMLNAYAGYRRVLKVPSPPEICDMFLHVYFYIIMCKCKCKCIYVYM